MNVSHRTLAEVINDNLGQRANKNRTSQLLTLKLKDVRLERSKLLLHPLGK